MFRAYDATRERLVAVKLFKLDLPPQHAHQLVAEFERLIAANLTHPAVAAPLATGISDVSAFLVQDYVAADSLDLAVREYGAAPASHVLRVATELAGAIDFAAAVQINHGAIHPRDVLLSSDDTRLTGLGITRALERIGVVAPVRRPYTAPERIAGGDWDRRADVFSLAALLHELMWAKRVSGLGAKAAASLTQIPGTDLSALTKVFARALAENPLDRFETALEFAEALRNACPDVAVAPPTPPAPKRRGAREATPRLPLDEASEPPANAVPRLASLDADHMRIDPPSEPEIAHAGGPTEIDIVPAAGPAEIDVARGPAPMRLEAAALATVEPEIVYQPAAAASPGLAPYDDSPATVASGFITGHDPDSISALERSRSAVWPLVLALIVGIGIGFAGGFFAGSREEPAAPSAPTPTPTAKLEVGSQKSEVEARKLEVGSQKSEVDARKSEVRSEKSEVDAPKEAVANPPPANRPPPSAAPEGRLLVRTRPVGARVSIDGKDYGVTPAAVGDLARGTHRVKITREGYVPEERRVVITTGKPVPALTIALVRVRPEAPARTTAAPTATAGRFVGALAVDSRPTGAKIFIDGKFVGTTPMALPAVPAGSHAIRLEHDGYRHWSSSVRIVASEQNRVTASLER